MTTTKTTLTREAVFDKAKPRYEVVQVEGWGTVGIKSISEVQRSRRASRFWDQDGELNEDAATMRRVHSIIDQVMVDEKTPMFSESDAKQIGELDPIMLDQLYVAIMSFNSTEEDAGKKDESSD